MSTILGEYGYKLTVDATEYLTKMNASKTAMNGFDKQLESSMSLLKTGLTASLITAGVAVGKFCTDAIKEFSAFEKKMNEVFTLLPNLSETSMQKMTEQAKKYAEQYGLQIQDVASGMYQSISAGVSQEDLDEMLTISTQASKGGVTDLTTAIDGLTSVVNSYGKEIIDYSEASDKMFTAVKLGKTTFEELSANLSDVVPIASSAKVAFADVTAEIATMTAQGINTAKTTTQLKQMYSELTDVESEIGKLFKSINGTSFNDFIANGGNTYQALQMIEEYANKSNVQINQLFSSLEAGQASLALTGKSAQTFANNLTAMNESSGATKKAFATMENGVTDSLDKIQAKMNNQLLEVGEKLEPLVLKGAEAVSGGLDIMSSAMDNTSVKIIATTATALALYEAFKKLQKTEAVTSMLNNLKSSIAGVQMSMIMAKEAELGFATTAKIATSAIMEQTSAFLATPVGAITAITVALVSYQQIYDAFVTTTEEADEKLTNTSNEFKDLTSEVANLNTELDTTQQRISELLAKDSLTVVEETELKKLQQTNAEIEKQIALKEKQKKLKAGEVSADFTTSVNTMMGDTNNEWYTPILQWFGLGHANITTNSEQFENSIKLYSEVQDKYIKALDEGNTEEAERYENQLNNLDTWMQGYANKLQGYIDELGDIDYDSLSDDAKKSYDYALDIQNRYLMLSDSASDIGLVFNNVINAGKYSEAKDALDALGNSGEVTADKIKGLYDSNDAVKQMIDYMAQIGLIDLSNTDTAFQSIADSLSQTAIMADKAKASVVAIEQITNALDTAQTKLNNLNAVVKEQNDNGFISIDTLKALSEAGYDYTTYLSYEDGQLKINESAYNNLVSAQLEELKIKQTLQATEDLKKISDEAQATEYLANVTGDLANAQSSAVESAFQMQLAMNMSKGGDVAKASQHIADSLQNFKTLCDSTKSSVTQLKSSNDDYTESINKQIKSLNAQKSALEEQKNQLNELKNDLTNAKDSITSLVSLVEDAIKQEQKTEKEALENSKKLIDDKIDAQKKLLEAEKEEANYNKTIRDKQNAVAKNSLSASILSLDDSGAGAKAFKQANDNYMNSQLDLADYLAEREFEIRSDNLDELKELTDKHYDDQISIIDKYLGNEVAIYKDACAEIDNDNGNLYGKLYDYVKTYTTKSDSEFNRLWSNAQTAISEYNTTNLTTLGLIDLLQQRVYDTDDAIADVSISINNVSSSINDANTSLSNYKDTLEKVIGNVEKLNSLNNKVNGYTIEYMGKEFSTNITDKNSASKNISSQISKYLGAYVPWESLLSGIKPYANGTLSASGGLSLVGERGAELRVLNKGDGIISSALTNRLMRFAVNPVGFMDSVQGGTTTNNVAPTVNMPITIQGDATEATVRALKKEAQKIADMANKQLMNIAIKNRHIVSRPSTFHY